jgi:hypothetical protein
VVTLPVTGSGDPANLPVGLRVVVGSLTHVILHAPDGTGYRGEIDGMAVEFSGEWAFLERDEAGVRRMQLVNGTRLKVGGMSLAGRMPPRGRVEAVDAEARALEVSSVDPLPTDGSLNGRTLIVSHPDYICNATFTVEGVEEVGGGRYRIRLGGVDLLLSEGRVAGVEAGEGNLLTDTPMLKLEVVGNLFDGKVVSSERGRPGPRLRTAGKGKLTLADPARASGFEGKPFYVYDVGAGDSWRIPMAAFRER